MTEEQALIDYLSKVTGTLIGIINEKSILSKSDAQKLLDIIGEGIDSITKGYKLQKSILDSKTQT